MKIIYYSPHPHLNLMSPSGYGTHMREMIIAFRKKGCEVLPVIMGGEDNPPTERLNQNSSGPKQFLKDLLSKKVWRTLKDFDLLQFDYFSAAKRLENAIKQFNPDCIYERCYYLQLSGIRMAERYALTHIMEINSPYVDQTDYLGNSQTYLKKYARHIEKLQLLDTDLPLAVVGPLRDYFCERYGIKPDRFLITHDAFNNESIQLDSDNQQKIIDRYQLHDKTIIGYIGSIFEWHRLDKLIKALHKLDLPDIKFLIVGYGAYMVKLMELVEDLGMGKQVIFTGRVTREEVFDHIKIMDICVAPGAAWYQSPVKIFEYGAMGKPIMAPRTDAVREIMKSGEDGILVDSSVESMKNGLQKLLSNKEQSRQMGQNFQKKVLNDYTWEKNAQKVIKAIRNLQDQPAAV